MDPARNNSSLGQYALYGQVCWLRCAVAVLDLRALCGAPLRTDLHESANVERSLARDVARPSPPLSSPGNCSKLRPLRLFDERNALPRDDIPQPHDRRCMTGRRTARCATSQWCDPAHAVRVRAARMHSRAQVRPRVHRDASPAADARAAEGLDVLDHVQHPHLRRATSAISHHPGTPAPSPARCVLTFAPFDNVLHVRA